MVYPGVPVTDEAGPLKPCPCPSSRRAGPGGERVSGGELVVGLQLWAAVPGGFCRRAGWALAGDTCCVLLGPVCCRVTDGGTCSPAALARAESWL